MLFKSHISINSFETEKSVEFYKKREYIIARDKYLEKLINARNNGFTIIGASDFMLNFI